MVHERTKVTSLARVAFRSVDVVLHSFDSSLSIGICEYLLNLAYERREIPGCDED
jgi:hypothetical protein